MLTRRQFLGLSGGAATHRCSRVGGGPEQARIVRRGGTVGRHLAARAGRGAAERRKRRAQHRRAARRSLPRSATTPCDRRRQAPVVEWRNGCRLAPCVATPRADVGCPPARSPAVRRLLDGQPVALRVAGRLVDGQPGPQAEDRLDRSLAGCHGRGSRQPTRSRLPRRRRGARARVRAVAGDGGERPQRLPTDGAAGKRCRPTGARLRGDGIAGVDRSARRAGADLGHRRPPGRRRPLEGRSEHRGRR